MQGSELLQSLLTEMGRGDCSQWIADVVREGLKGEMYPAIGELWDTLLRKVEKNETITLVRPARTGGGTVTIERLIVQTHPKVIIFALKKLMNEAMSFMLPKGHFQRYASLTRINSVLGQRTKERRQSSGDEASQRRDMSLYDHEQVELYASILRCDIESRHDLDALTLLTITAVYMSIGKRGMSIDAIRHGNISVTRWNTPVWDRTIPIVLQFKTAAKGDSLNATPHLEQVMHHRCPMRDAPAACGHYFAFQFFHLMDTLPTIGTWLTDMHQRPFIRLLKGDAACVTGFNSKLQENLNVIGADPSITFHFFRDVLIGEAGERGDQRQDIVAGSGHSTAVHERSYRSVVRSWVLGSVGYSTQPEMLASWVDVLYDELDSDGQSLTRRIVDHLYSLRPDDEMLKLEASVQYDTSREGTRLREWLHMVRVCITSWIVSCAARPRDRFYDIVEHSPIKLELICPTLLRGMISIFRTAEFATLCDRVRQREERELGMGELAHCNASERRVRSEMMGIGSRVTDLKMDVQSIPQTLAKMQTDIETQVSTVPSKVTQLVETLPDEVASKVTKATQDHLSGIQVEMQERHKDALYWSSLEHKDISSTDHEAIRRERIRRESYGKAPTRQWVISVDDATGQSRYTLDPSLSQKSRSPRLGLLPQAVSKTPSHDDKRWPLDVPSSRVTVEERKRCPSPTSVAASESPKKKPTVTESDSLPRASPPVASTSAPVESAAPSCLPSTSLMSSAPMDAVQNDDDAPSQPTEDLDISVFDLDRVRDVPHLLTLFHKHIAPKEREGSKWRSTAVVGKPKMQAWSDKFSSTFHPFLLFVCSIAHQDGISIMSAARRLEARRKFRTWTVFRKDEIPATTTYDPKTKQDYIATLLSATALSCDDTMEGASVSPGRAVSQTRSGNSTATSEATIDKTNRRYLGIDPGMSCGWALIQVSPTESRITSIDVGLLKVDASTACVGRRAIDLQQRLMGLLTSSRRPEKVFFEKFHGHSRVTDDVSYGLRTAIRMLLIDLEIPFSELEPQTWKKSITNDGRADKSVVARRLEKEFGTTFPAQVPVGDATMVRSTDDVTDAVGIALCGVRQTLPDVFYDDLPLRVETPFIPRQSNRARPI